MKKTLRIGLCFCIVLLSNSSLAFIPFPFNNAVWKYGRYDFSCPGMGNYCGQIVYKFLGDTTISGRNYNKLYSSSFPDTNYLYTAALRQDSINGNIYIVMANGQCNSADTLLYNFNLSLNDTINQCIYFLGQLYTTIQEIDSVNLGGQWRHRIKLSDNNNSNLIEGIGSTSGLIGPWNGWLGGYLLLECFELNGTAIFPYSSCFSTSAENPIQEAVMEPVINSGKLLLRIPSSQSFSNAELYSITGQYISSLKKEGSFFTCDIEMIPSGMYIIRVSLYGHLINIKLFLVK